jgi:hypothetical protein
MIAFCEKGIVVGVFLLLWAHIIGRVFDVGEAMARRKRARKEWPC